MWNILKKRKNNFVFEKNYLSLPLNFNVKFMKYNIFTIFRSLSLVISLRERVGVYSF